MQWNVNTIQNLCEGNMFFLEIFDDDSGDAVFGSHYFNLTYEDGSVCASSPSSSSTASTASSTSTTTPDTSAVTITQSAKPTSAQPISVSTAQPRNDSISSSASIGIGVATGLVGCLAVCIGVFCFWTRRQKNAAKVQSGSYSQVTLTGYAPSPRFEHKHEMAAQSALILPR